MNLNTYVDKTYGSVVRVPRPYGYAHYNPAHVPTNLDLDHKTVAVLSKADRALGRLAGAGGQWR